MKCVALIFGLLLSVSSYGSDLSEWLMSKNPHGYFPKAAEYSTYKDVCNVTTCFHLVAVYYVTATNKGMRRIAVFSESGSYLGVYSGFNDMPVKLVGSQLIFPMSEFGSSIDFNESQPPAKAYIDGENFEFESKP